MKRILMLVPRPWDSTWGQEKDLIGELNETYSFTVLEHLDYDNLKKTYSVPKNTKVIYRKTKRKPSVAYLLEFGYRNLRDSWKYDHDIYITYATLGNMVTVLSERLRGKKVLLIYADDLPELYKKRSAIGAWVTKYISNPVTALCANHIVTTAHLLREDIGFKGKSTYLPNGVHVSSIKKAKTKKKPFTVGFVGFFGEWINFDMLLEAAKQNPKVRFLLVGGGGDYEAVKKKARGLKNVVFTGFVHRDRAYEYIRDDMDVCSVPFHVNRLTDRVSPIKLFEYWAHGKPVISSRFYEVEKTGKGIVQFADTVQEFSKVLSELQKSSYYKTVAAKGLTAVKQYDWSALGRRYKEILQKHLS
jgi:glycosyltransferase involved in cell wall biosynthesis